ncbi:MAG TPA: hypothetical protein VFF38_11410 [Microvirga sp.]|nr:hypothetical protein [Microvirga sp.]
MSDYSEGILWLQTAVLNSLRISQQRSDNFHFLPLLLFGFKKYGLVELARQRREAQFHDMKVNAPPTATVHACAGGQTPDLIGMFARSVAASGNRQDVPGVL